MLIQTAVAGGPEFVATFDAETAAVTRMDTAMAGMARTTEATSRRSGFFMNQLLFSLRRYTFYGTTALAAMGAGAIIAGFKFDSMMQSSQLAFSGLLHSSAAAKQELDLLFKTAAHSPFLFQNLTQSARLLLAFGMTQAQTNDIIMTSANALAYFGKSGADLENVAATFGKIGQSGFLMMRQMRQLTVAGIPVFPALRKELHLTQAQIDEFMRGKLRIPSDVGIAALLHYMQTHFSDGMARFSKTWTGRWTTFKDYTMMIMGKLEQGPFNSLLSKMGDLNNALSKLIDAYNKAGFKGFISTLDSMIGAGGMLQFTIDQLKTAFVNWWAYFKNNILPTLKFGIGVFVLLFSVILWGINTVLGPFAKNIHFLRFLIDAWIVALALQVTWTVLSAIAQEFWNTAMELGWLAMRAMVILGGIWEGVLIALNLANWALFGSEMSVDAALFIFRLEIIATMIQVRLLTAAQWLLNLAMDANPVGAIILGFTLLILVIYELYQHYHNLRKAILDGLATAYLFAFPFIAAALLIINHWSTVKGWFVTFFHWLESAWNAITSVVTGVAGIMAGIIVQAFNTVVGLIKGGVNWILNGLNWVIDKINWATGAYNQVFGWATGNVPKIPHIPTLARGGDITQAGLAIIAERGPEAVFLPMGAQVRPMESLDSRIAKRQISQPKLQALIPLSIDGNAIAQYTADIILTTQAGMGAA